jgi:hypothetical protein
MQDVIGSLILLLVLDGIVNPATSKPRNKATYESAIGLKKGE